MAIPFQIPGQQQYMPKVQPNEDLTAGANLTPMGQPTDPIQARIIDRIMQTVNEEPPVAPPKKKHSKVAQFFINTDPYFSAVSQANYQSTPEYQEYTRKMEAYKARQEALKTLGGVAGTIDRSAQANEREQRLQDQFEFRQKMASQFRPETKQEYDSSTGTNRFHTLYRDPMRNNQIVYDEWTDYAPIHTGQYPGEGGEPTTYATSPVPQGPPVPRSDIAPPPNVPPASGLSAGAPGVLTVPKPTQGGVLRPSSISSNKLTPGHQEKNAAHQAPTALTEQAIRQNKFLGGLGGAMQAVDQAHTAQVARFGQSFLGMIGQVAQDKLAQDRYGRAFVSKFGDPEVSDYYNKVRLSVYDYVKAQTGAQFSITEMDRYLASFPTSVDDPTVAKNLILEHAQRAVREINTLKLNWHSINVGDKRVYVEPGFLDEFLRTGGMQPEIQPVTQQPVDEAEAILNKHLEIKRARAGARQPQQ